MDFSPPLEWLMDGLGGIAQEDVMIRVGITGTECSHAGEFVASLAGQSRVQLVACLPGEGEPVPGVDVVSDMAELVRGVDAVAIFDRDPRRHAELALPALAAGRPTFVDKPMTSDLGQARELVETAASAGVGLTSFSALRFLPQVDRWHQLVEQARQQTGVAAVSAVGPADPDGPHAGAWFYGVHVPEMLRGLVQGLDGVVVEADQSRVRATGVAPDGVEVSMTLVDDDAQAFMLGVVDAQGQRQLTTLEVGADYYAGAAQELIGFLAGDTPSVSVESMFASLDATERMVNAWREAGRG